MAGYITWRIKPETSERLRAYGIYGDSQDSVVRKVLDLADRYQSLPKPTEPQKLPDKGYEAPQHNNQAT